MSPEVRLASAQEEARLRREVLEAREACERARQAREMATQMSDALDASNPDGGYAFGKVEAQHTAALDRYIAALHNLSDFVLNRRGSGPGACVANVAPR